MAIGLFWSSICLVIFVSILVYDRMGGFLSKNKFPVDGRVRSENREDKGCPSNRTPRPLSSPEALKAWAGVWQDYSQAKGPMSWS